MSSDLSAQRIQFNKAMNPAPLRSSARVIGKPLGRQSKINQC